MSGVFGLADANQGTHLDRTLKQMGEELSHRSWFCTDSSTDQANGVYLGRIGIGVFNKADQPCISEDGRITIFLTGEFYNTEKIKKTLQANGVLFRDDSDIELALRLYQEHGMDFLNKLNGIFLLLIYDAANRQLYLANDRFGLYPIYYMHRNGRFIFGPEVKSILVQDDFQPKQDLVAMAEYFRFQFLLGDKTFFRG
jgi:asparagine synthase (glutamine-hydrolysing)